MWQSEHLSAPAERIVMLPAFLKWTNTGPFTAWFVVTGVATPDGIRVVWSVLGAISSIPIVALQEWDVVERAPLRACEDRASRRPIGAIGLELEPLAGWTSQPGPQTNRGMCQLTPLLLQQGGHICGAVVGVPHRPLLTPLPTHPRAA